jgi:uncharacterized tellurite resistance protein B-like protein
MGTFLVILFALLALLGLTALISGLVLYAQFRRSPERQWRAEVLGLLADAGRRSREERLEVRRLAAALDGEGQALRQEAFRDYLGEVAVEQLSAYPGIGPATVAKLRAAGYASLARLHNARLRLPGLGPKRLADIGQATAALLREADSTFAAGRCEQARALAEDLARLRAKYDRLRARAEARTAAAEVVIERLAEPSAAARTVTFWRWFRPISDEPLLPPEVMEAPLPDLEAALRAADEPPVAVAVPAAPRPAPRPAPKDRAAARVAQRASAAAPHREEDMPDETHLILMDLTLQFAFGVARADGPVSAPERDLIHQHVRQRFAYNRALLNRAEAICAHYESAAIDLEHCLEQMRQRMTPGHRAALMTFAAGVVAASGPTGSSAADYLSALAKRLGVPPSPPPATLAPRPAPPTPAPAPPRPAAPARVAAAALPRSAAATPSPPPPPPPPPAPAAQPPAGDEWRALLEISAGAPLSADLVRRQYHLLVQRYAPERVASMGPEFVQMAAAKLAAARRAAEGLLAPLGEPLEVKAAAPPADLRHNPDLDDVFGGT